MVAGEQRQSIGQGVLCAVGEFQFPSSSEFPGAAEMLQYTVEGNLSQAYDDAQIFKGSDLLVEVGSAIGKLARKRLITGRRTPHHGSDLHSCKPHPVIPAHSIWLGSEAGFVENRVQKVA